MSLSSFQRVAKIPGRNSGRVPKIVCLSRLEGVVVRPHGEAATHKKGKVAAAVAMDEVRDGGSSAAAVDEGRDGGASAVDEVWDGGAAAAEEEVRDVEKPLTGPDLADILRRCNDGGKAYYHVHETDVYSDGPDDLVQGRQHALRATGHGSQKAWLFYTHRPLANDAGNRCRRKVGKDATWKAEGTEPSILGADGQSILAYVKRFSYMIKSPTGSGRGRQRTGWSMFEISQQEIVTDQKVLCMLCKSNHNHTKASTATSSAGEETSPVKPEEDVHDSFNLPGGDMSYPAPVPVAPPISAVSISLASEPRTQLISSRTAASMRKGKAVEVAKEVRGGEHAARELTVMALDESSIPSAERFRVMAEHILSLINERSVVVLSAIGGPGPTKIVQAARNALRCGEASEIHDQLTATKDLYLGTVYALGLDSSTVTGSLNLLEQHLQSVVLTQELTPMTEDYLISFRERIAATILCTFLKKHGQNTQQIWKDAHGVLKSDPNICTNALSNAYLTFDEAIELACSGAQVMLQSMRLAMEGDIPVIVVKNSYSPQATGTTLTQSILSSIMLKPNIVMLDILSIGDSSLLDFQAQVFLIFKALGILVDFEANRDGTVSLTLHPSKQCGSKLTQREIVNAVEKVKKIAVVQLEHISIISLVGNIHEAVPILAKAIDALASVGVHAKKVSQRSSKAMEVTLVVDDNEANDCVRALHSVFFEMCVVSEVGGAENGSPLRVNSHAAASSVVKRKAENDHPESPRIMRQEQAVTEHSVHEETEPRFPWDNVGDLTWVFDNIRDDNISLVTANHGWDPSMLYTADIERLLSEEIPIGGDEIDDCTKYFFGIVDDGYDAYWMLSGSNDGAGPSGVGAGVPEHGENPVLPEQPADVPVAGGSYP